MTTTTTQPAPLAGQLRNALRADGRSVARIAELADVDPSVIHRFIAAERTVTLDTAARLAEVLGYALAPKGRKAGRPRREAER